MDSSIPNLITGGRHKDVRGALRFCNDFDMSPVKRFYTISNSAKRPVRGWIGHKRETKWFFPICGITQIEVRNMNDEESPKEVFVLDSSEPRVLCVPPGYWFCIIQDKCAEVQVFSNCKVGEFENDDFRKEIKE